MRFVPAPAALSLDHLSASYGLLALFVLVAILAGIAYQVGLLGRLLGAISTALQTVVTAGFNVWRICFSWAPWPVVVSFVVGLHYLAWSGPSFPFLRALLCGLGLLFLGVVACLAYVFIDLERYEVGRGYKALHNPLKGQELAFNLARYGHRVGIPLLVTATLATVSGFALFNEGLYGTVGRSWYTLDPSKARLAAQEPETDEEAPPGYPDFLAYTLLNLSRAVDLLHVAESYNVARIAYVHQAKWPASTLLVLFRTFFTMVLLQQLFAGVRRFKLLGETIQDFWSPHESITERARGSLAEHGAAAVRPLLRSIAAVRFLTAEQRAEIPAVVASIGPVVIPVLRKHLQDANENVRAVAVGALGELQALEVVPVLVQFDEDPSEWVRLALVEALASLCGPGEHAMRKRWSIRVSVKASRRWLGWAFRWRLWLSRGRLAHPVELAVSALRKLTGDAVPAVRARAAETLGALGRAAAAAAPELITLLADTDESIRRRAAEALGEVGGPANQAVAALTPLLRDASAEVRSAAALALGTWKAEAAEAIADLVPLMQDRVEPVRQAAAEAIKQIGTLDQQANPLLAEGLASPDNLVRAQTAEALGQIGESAAEVAPALIDALGDPSDRVRARAAEALGKIGPTAAPAVPALIVSLRDPDHRVSALSAAALGELGEAARAAVPALVEGLRHLNATVRASAAAALGKIGDSSGAIEPALRQACSDEEGIVRAAALRAFAEVAAPGGPARETLRSATEDADPLVRTAAIEALGRRGETDATVVEALTHALHDTSDPVKIAAALALPRLAEASPAVMEGLCRLLGDDTADVQAAAALALGKLGPGARAAGEPLLRALQTASAPVREPILRAFALIEPPEAPAAFVLGLKDSDGEIRKLASAGLVKIEGLTAAILPLLMEALTDPEVQVRSNAAHALGRFETLPDEAVPLLVECTADPDDGLRLNATRALKAASPEAMRTVLQRLIADPSTQVRLVAARFLLGADAADARATEVLLGALTDSAGRFRRTALDVLESLGKNAMVVLEIVRQRETELAPQVREAIDRLLRTLEQQTAAVQTA